MNCRHRTSTAAGLLTLALLAALAAPAAAQSHQGLSPAESAERFGWEEVLLNGLRMAR